jgi:predicted phosphodiesterase
MDLESLKEFATERQCEIIDAVILHGSNSKAAEALKTDKRAMIRAIKRAKSNASRQGWSPDHDYTRPVPDTYVVKGVSTFYDENGKPIRQWVKSDLKRQSHEEALEAFVEALKDDLPKYQPLASKPLTTTAEELTAYVIGDAHIGMKVSKDRNGDSDWNLEIAERVTLGAIEKLIKASGPTEVGLMLDLGDFGHSDNLQNTTSSGQNHMDMDGDFGDSIAAQVRIYRKALDMMLKNHNRVVLMQVRGNHNSSTSRCMNVMFQSFFAEEPRLEILDNAHKFQNIVYGNNLIVSHHGDRMKHQRGFEYATRSLSKDWGLPFKHLLMGHVHHHTATEIGGMLCETFQALPASDAWHADSGYGAKRTMTAIVYDKQHGEVQRHKVGIGQLT